MNELAARALAVWRGQPRRARIAFAAAVIAIVAFALIASLSLRDTRVALFANPLKTDQLAEVDAQLSAWNVAFIPSADNVRIAPRRRAELLARLAVAGVPHAHVMGTSEALATIGTLTPQAILDAQARAGLEGDLEKGLRGIGGIGDARIIIAPARGGLFADEAPTPASASVRLIAAPGQIISASALAAVRAFVAAGVPGLRAERVAVVDDRGELFDQRRAQRVVTAAAPHPTIAHARLVLVLGFLRDVAPSAALFGLGAVAIRSLRGPLAAVSADFVHRRRLERVPGDSTGISPAAIFARLRDEPPHAAAAVIGRLATPLASAVLELYGESERRAIVARLARKVSPLVPDAESLLRDG